MSSIGCLTPELPQRVRVHGVGGTSPTLSSEHGRGHGVPSVLAPTQVVAVDIYNQTTNETSQALSSSASDIHHTGGGDQSIASNGRPSPNTTGMRTPARIQRRSHFNSLARQIRRTMPGWAALQGAGQQHGRSLHGVDRVAHRRAGVGAAALSFGVQWDRSREHGVGAARVATRRLCRGGKVSKCRLGASLAASAEHGRHEQP